MDWWGKILFYKADACTEEESKEKYVSLSDRVNDMVETVKHAIVLLQIAKVSFCTTRLFGPFLRIKKNFIMWLNVWFRNRSFNPDLDSALFRSFFGLFINKKSELVRSKMFSKKKKFSVYFITCFRSQIRSNVCLFDF